MNNIKTFLTAEETAQELAHYIKNQINKTPKEYYMAISGGSTPKMLFEALIKIKDSITWNKLKLFWVDERCVPPTHDESNFKMTNESLLSKCALPEENIFRMKGELQPQEGLLDYERLILNVPKNNNLPVFDLIILGMGDDGHTASIFPPDLHLLEIDNPLAIGTNPYSGQKRLTLTGKTIKNAKEIIFHVTGSGKATVLKEILNKENNYKKYPSSEFAFLNNTSWFLDKNATESVN